MTYVIAESLPGRDEPLRSPGGASKAGRVGVDTELVDNHDPSGQ